MVISHRETAKEEVSGKIILENVKATQCYEADTGPVCKILLLPPLTLRLPSLLYFQQQ